jgi:type I restriction enzyme S subunit
LKTEPGEYPLVVTAAYRRGANSYQLEGPAVCVPLISSTGHGDAALHRVHYQEGKFALANLLVALLPKDPNVCNGKYLYHLLTAKKDEYFVPLMLGTANVSLKEKDVGNVEIPLPPVEEQRRIVARIEELSAKIKEARELRRQAAVEAEALVGAGASKHFQEFAEWHPVEAIAEVRGGIQKGPHRAAGAHPVRYLTVAHVQRNRILTDNPRFFEVAPEELDRWRLFSGDVLIIEGNGSAEQIGRTALFRGEIENCVHQNHIIRIRPNPQQVLPEFLNSFLNSPAGQDAVQGQSRTTSGLRTLSVGRINAIPVPVPPLSEQRRLVAYLDDLQQKRDTLKAMQAETSAELDALMPSILDKAFRVDR